MDALGLETMVLLTSLIAQLRCCLLDETGDNMAVI